MTQRNALERTMDFIKDFEGCHSADGLSKVVLSLYNDSLYQVGLPSVIARLDNSRRKLLCDLLLWYMENGQCKPLNDAAGVLLERAKERR